MTYIPEQGDILTLLFSPQSGHEQSGRRPALVVSNHMFNRFTKMALVCPISNTNKGFPLHVPLDHRTTTTGVVLCEQVKSLDITARGALFQEKAPREVVDEVLDVLVGFIE